MAREFPALLYGVKVACAEMVREYGASWVFGNVVVSFGF